MIIEEQFDFSTEKNQQLVSERDISFEVIISALQNGNLLDILEHPNKKKYAHQYIYVVNINNYVYLVPFVRKEDNTVFLKTIFPSRKFTKQYLGQLL
ncbi:MAG: DUF4258 domain-containing protein [Gammaproteobacteria bacterium]